MSRPPTPEAKDEDKEPTLQETINLKLVNSGEKERLKTFAKEKLAECGWRDEMKAKCREIIKEHGGRENLTVEQLVREITPIGRASVPDPVKAELLAQIKKSLNLP